ncbi:hypothetical protein L249_3134 [Ophiocordyceps polyrhachis-furcata BCC 54312]|uniref:N-acetyltransferase domain-containing protein n=1 Tax=Ophiocordyceps polyrhachis-furcata BCC 54312 TaxID=1330021 RepID=A0A367LSI1_9HYPO|nr:hypothetical protein L249_3134 [Ophiocordyceps polyrhachis-furcata BCC 54312]
MPAMLDDPARPAIRQWPSSENMPGPLPKARCVTLRDGHTKATILPFTSPDRVPASLLEFLCDQFNKEIEAGDTYPMVDAMTVAAFGEYWFQTFAAIMLLGVLDDVNASSNDDVDYWSDLCLGSYYVKPNYPGRSSHVCNAGFLVAEGARNRGVGRLLGESYVDWAPKLGFSYSVFNLVYESNLASIRIWDQLGFKPIGRVRGCGRLKSYPDKLVDAIIYGRELVDDGASS